MNTKSNHRFPTLSILLSLLAGGWIGTLSPPLQAQEIFGNSGIQFEQDTIIEQIVQLLTGRRATSILLVGEPGCGKTAVINQLAREKRRYGLKERPIWQTSGSRIVAGMSGFGDWQERCRKITKEAKESDAILYFGNLFELLQVGQSSCSSESVGSVFRGPLLRGEFHALTECTPRQLALIEQLEPRVLDAFRQIRIEPANPETSLVILNKRADEHGQRFEPGAVPRILSLHQRYAGYSALPGKAVRFLDRLVEETHDRQTEEPSSIDTH